MRIRLNRIVVTSGLAACAAFAAEPAWQTATMRAAQRIVRQDSRPVAVGSQRTTTMLLDRLVTPRSSARWYYLIEWGQQVMIADCKQAIVADVDQPAQFRRDGGAVHLRGTDGKSRKCAVFAQMSLADAMEVGK